MSADAAKPESSPDPATRESSDGESKARMYKRVQAVTGIIMAMYTTLHMGNHFFMHFGPDAHRAVFRQVRKLYTAPIAEAVLLFSMSVHAFVALLRYRGIAKEKPRAFFQLAGWFLTTVMPGHIYYTRVVGPSVGLAEYDVSHAATASRIFPAFFVPYYVLMSASGAYHTFLGLQKAGVILDLQALKQLPSRGKDQLKWGGLLALISVSSALAITGVYSRYHIAEEKLLLNAYHEEWPKALFKFVRMPEEGAWFGTLKFSS